MEQHFPLVAATMEDEQLLQPDHQAVQHGGAEPAAELLVVAAGADGRDQSVLEFSVEFFLNPIQPGAGQ